MIRRLAGIVGWGLAIAAAGWWLFADTLAHYQPGLTRGSTDTTTIRFSHFGSYQDYALWEGVIAAFEQENPRVRVSQEYVPGWYGRYDTKIRQQILSGTLPEVALMQVAPFRGLVEHFAGVDRPIAGTIALTGLEAFTFPEDGTLRGMPVSGGNLLIYLNPDCVERASAFHGRPIELPSDDWTVEEFRQIARALTVDLDGDGQLDQFGFWLPRWLYYLPFIWSFGADVMVDGEWALTGSEAAAAFDFYRDLAVTHRVCPEPADVAQLIQDTGFLTGKVAMCVNGPWFQPFLNETSLKDRYIVMPMPRGPAGRRTRVTWDGLCIADGLPYERRDVADRFVKFCVSESAQRMIAETGRALPSLRSALPAFATDERRGRFVEALVYSRLQPMLPQFRNVDRTIHWQLYRWMHVDVDMSADAFLDDLARHDAIVEAFGVDR